MYPRLTLNLWSICFPDLQVLGLQVYPFLPQDCWIFGHITQGPLRLVVVVCVMNTQHVFYHWASTHL